MNSTYVIFNEPCIVVLHVKYELNGNRDYTIPMYKCIGDASLVPPFSVGFLF